MNSKNHKILVYTATMKINNINNIDLEFECQKLEYILKSGFVIVLFEATNE
jgi:hypothetical protein